MIPGGRRRSGRGGGAGCVLPGLGERSASDGQRLAQRQAGGGDGGSGEAGEAAAEAAEVLAGASRLIEGDTGDPLTPARDYDRPARERRGRLVTGSAGGSALRAAALRMAQGGHRPGRSEAAQVAVLIRV